MKNKLNREEIMLAYSIIRNKNPDLVKPKDIVDKINSEFYSNITVEDINLIHAESLPDDFERESTKIKYYGHERSIDY